MKNYVQKFILIFAALFLFAGCTINTTVKGKITDENAVAIENANITISYSENSYETQTDSEGNYSINATVPITEETNFVISKDGYKTLENSVLISYKYLNKTFKYNASLEIEEPEIVVEYGSITGIIKDISGNLISGATVQIGNQAFTSDALGVYTATNIVVSDKVSVSVSKDTYAQNANVIFVKKDETSTLDFTLLENDVVVSFDSSTNNEIKVKDAFINFVANSFVDSTGNEYTGNITTEVSFHQPSSYIGRLAFPGEYEGTRADGSTTLIQSYGFFNVELIGENGEQLNLKDGTTATLTFPADSNLEHFYESIPLWYYDINLGTWIEEGLAIYDVNTNTYTGTVSHFTAWNLDQPQPRATVNCLVLDNGGNPVSNVKISTVATSYFKQNIYTDANGTCSLVVPAGIPFKLYALKGLDNGESDEYTLSTADTQDITITLNSYNINDYKNISITGNVIINNDEVYNNTSTNVSATNTSNNYNYWAYNNLDNSFTVSNVEIKIAEDNIFKVVVSGYQDNWAPEQSTYAYVNYQKELDINIPLGFIGNTLNLGTITLHESDITSSGEFNNEIIECEVECIETPMPL